MDLSPVLPVTGPFFRDIHGCQIQHFQKAVIRRKNRFAFGHFPEMCYENVGNSVKADIFGFDIANVSGSIRLFSDVMKRMGIKLDGDELYEEFQRIYGESTGRDADIEK